MNYNRAFVIIILLVLIYTSTINVSLKSGQTNPVGYEQPNEYNTIPPIWVRIYPVSTYGIDVIDKYNYIAIGEYNYRYPIVFKLNEYGDVEKAKLYNEENSMFNDIKYTPDDKSYIIVGKYYGSVLVLKLDENFNIIWQKRYGGSGNDIGLKVLEADEGYFIIGQTYFGAGSRDIWILKIDKYGNVIWQKAYGTPNDDILMDAERTYDGGLILIGHTYLTNRGYYGYVMKVDINGDLEWVRLFTPRDSSYGNLYFTNIELIDTDRFIIIGNMQYGIGGPVILLNSTGDIIWHYAVMGRRLYDVLTINNSIIVLGLEGDRNLTLFKLDDKGSIVWAKKYLLERYTEKSIYRAKIKLIDNKTLLMAGSYYGSPTILLKILINGFINGCKSDRVYNLNLSNDIISFELNIEDINISVFETPVNVMHLEYSMQDTYLDYTNTICYFSAVGKVTVRVNNIPNMKMPEEGGVILAKLYTMRDNNLVFLNTFSYTYKGLSEYVDVNITGLRYNETYIIEVYNIPNSTVSAVEYWGMLEFIYGGEFTRTPLVIDFYKSTPMATEIDMPARVLKGQPFNINVTMIIPETIDGLNITVVFDRDGASPWDYAYSRILPGLLEAGELNVEFQPILDLEGSYKVYVFTYFIDGKKLYDYFASEQLIEVGPNITVRIHNIQGYSMPGSGGEILVELYEINGDLSLKSVASTTYSGSENYVEVEFGDLEFKRYLIKVYNVPKNGLRVKEYWGSLEFSYNLQDHVDFYRQTPQIVSVTAPSRVLAGQPITLFVKVIIPQKLEGLSFEVYLDSDARQPWDYRYVYSFNKVQGSGLTQFQLNPSISEEGNYTMYIIIRSQKNGVIYDQWGWSELIQVEYGSLSLRLHNTDTSSLPISGGSLLVELYQEVDDDWVRVAVENIAYKGGENYVTINFKNMIFGQQYMVKIYNKPSRGLLDKEYWGYKVFVYTNQGVIDFYRAAPLVVSVQIPSSVQAGSTAVLNVTLEIPVQIDGVNVTVILDEDKREPWDHVLYFAIDRLSPGTETISIHFTPAKEEIGRKYNVYIIIYKYGKHVVYSQSGWNGPIYISMPEIDVEEIMDMIDEIKLALEQVYVNLTGTRSSIEAINESLINTSITIDQKILMLTSLINKISNATNLLQEELNNYIKSSNNTFASIKQDISLMKDEIATQTSRIEALNNESFDSINQLQKNLKHERERIDELTTEIEKLRNYIYFSLAAASIAALIAAISLVRRH
jgi:hypothetical protein